MIKKSKVCLICKNRFDKPENNSIKQWKLRKFCSLECFGKWSSQQESILKGIKGVYRSGSFKKGHKPWNKGQVGMYTDKTIKEMRKSARKGENSNFWQGGGTKITELIRACSKYAEWRDKIYFRDNYTCQDCGKKGKKIHAHHLKLLVKIVQQNKIKVYQDFIKCDELWNLENGITLCEECHRKRHKK